MKCGQALLGLVLMQMLVSCGGSAPPTGVSCTVNSECKNPLSCTFGKCHETCREARDCPSGHRCVAAPTGAVCQLEGKCAYLSDCPLPLVCAIDRQCRSECQQDRDCATQTQKCVLPDRVCAEPEEVDTTGKLKAAQDGAVPPAPPGVDGGAPGADGSFASDAPAADGPLAGDGGLTADAPLAPDLARDVNLGDIPVGPCGFQDPNEPSNDQRETATPLPVGVVIQGCVAGNSPAADSDYFELVAPDDPAGGYFQITVGDVGDGRIGMTVYSGADNALILDPLAPLNAGASVSSFVSTAPGQHYRVQVSHGGAGYEFKNPYRYTISATYTKIDDAYEPNDTRAAAKTIPLGTPVKAFMTAGFTTGHLGYADGRQNGVNSQDWYKVDGVAMGAMLKTTVDNTAADLRVAFFVFNSLGMEVARADSQNPGAGASVTVMAAMTGTYFIQVVPSGTTEGAGHEPMPAPTLTTPYTLTVSQ